jgi:hypothetical protein
MTLKTFIHAVGFVLFMIVVGAVLYLDARTFLKIQIPTAVWTILVLAVPNAVAFFIAHRLWKMVSDWNRAVVADYADVQSLFTGLVLGRIAAFFWPHAIIIPTLGFLLFLGMRGFLCRYLLAHFGFPDPKRPGGRGGGSDSEVAGTPWQTKPGYTVR